MSCGSTEHPSECVCACLHRPAEALNAHPNWRASEAAAPAPTKLQAYDLPHTKATLHPTGPAATRGGCLTQRSSPAGASDKRERDGRRVQAAGKQECMCMREQ